MKTIVTIPATGLVIPLLLAKQHLRVDTDDGSDDDLITHLIHVATERAEHQTGRSLLTKTYKTIAEFGEKIKLTPNLIAISSVVLTNDDNTTVNLVLGDYCVKENGLVPEVLPLVLVQQSIAVTYSAGYGTADSVPHAIKQWLLVDLATLYENREAVITYGVNSVPYPFVDGLLDPFRVQY